MQNLYDAAIETNKKHWHMESFNEVFVDYLVHEYRLNPDIDKSPAIIWATTPSPQMIRWDELTVKTAAVRMVQLEQNEMLDRLGLPPPRTYNTFDPVGAGRQKRDNFFACISTPVHKRRRGDKNGWYPTINHIILGRIEIYFHMISGEKVTPYNMWGKIETINMGGPTCENIFDGSRARAQFIEGMKLIRAMENKNSTRYELLRSICCLDQENWVGGRIFIASKENESVMKNHINHNKYRDAIRLAESGVLTEPFMDVLARLRSDYNNYVNNPQTSTDMDEWVRNNIDNRSNN